MSSTPYPKRSEKKFNEHLVSQYLKHESVDEVFAVNKDSLPISYAQYQRVLDEWGIVKTAGANKKLNEVLEFVYSYAYRRIPFKRLYKSMPPSFKTSAATLYRILSYVKEGITRRMATGLIITPYGSKTKILVAKDVSTPRVELGKPFGSITIPLSFSRIRDPRERAILRVLQHEVFANLAIKKKMPQLIPDNPKPFMLLDIADVRVEIFVLELSKKLSNTSNFSSFKLRGYKFLPIENVLKESAGKYRAGVLEAVKGYKRHLELQNRSLANNPLIYRSEVNYELSKGQGRLS